MEIFGFSDSGGREGERERESEGRYIYSVQFTEKPDSVSSNSYIFIVYCIQRDKKIDKRNISGSFNGVWFLVSELNDFGREIVNLRFFFFLFIFQNHDKSIKKNLQISQFLLIKLIAT